MPKRFRNAAGPAVRRLRVERKLTQDQLAARLVLAGLVGADRVWVAKAESQIRSVFDFEMAVIAAVLGVKADELLPGGEGRGEGRAVSIRRGVCFFGVCRGLLWAKKKREMQAWPRYPGLAGLQPCERMES